jgi:hypothetical protein
MDLGFPDVALTPPAMAPVPYANKADGSMAVGQVSNVFFGGAQAHNLSTKIPITDGKNAGVAGVASGTSASVSRPVTGATKVLLGGMPASRLTSMNQQNSGNVPGARVSPSQTKVLLLAP